MGFLDLMSEYNQFPFLAQKVNIRILATTQATKGTIE
jgi:hypothetical protein